MVKRYVSIWFRYLSTDWFALRRPELKTSPFVLRAPSHGRMIVTGINAMAETNGVYTGMVLADARAIIPGLEVQDDIPTLPERLLKRLAEWCIRFSPVVSIDLPDGLILDASGCTHLWGGDRQYITDINNRLTARGYQVRISIADTIGAAWGMARFGKGSLIIPPGENSTALLPLPAASMRPEQDTLERLQKLGLRQVHHFISMPRPALRRRFGEAFIRRIDQALGSAEEIMQPVQPVEPWQERLPCLEPILTATAIEIALQRLLDTLCRRLQKEQKGLRSASFQAYRMDGKMVEIQIGTNRPTHHTEHLYKLFEIKLQEMAPEPGIELFVLVAGKVEDHIPVQLAITGKGGGLQDTRIAELLDRIAGKFGPHIVQRYLPDEHHWPERSIRTASSLQEKPITEWRTDRPRPIQLLPKPELIEVTAPIPDYPPMMFRYKGKLYTIKKADGPERIEREWWLDEGEHRDYYAVEDDQGRRYWLFRSGHYSEEKKWQWYLCGFFA
jgi:protein ImuB